MTHNGSRLPTHTHTHTIPPWEDQCEWHRMARMTGPDCAVMCNLTNTHTLTLTNRQHTNNHTTHTNTHTHAHTGLRGYVQFNKYTHTYRMTRMTGPDCAVVCNLINTHTHTHTHTLLLKIHGPSERELADKRQTEPATYGHYNGGGGTLR